MAALPGFSGPKSYAGWPVWSDSARADVRFQPIPKKAATRLWHRARDFDRQTRRKDRHGGAVGHSALQVLHALIFDFLNFHSGQLDPSYAAIARKANVCERTVATAIKRLKGLGILNWVRRCAETWRDGRYVLEQETNAYAVLPASQWRGYREPPEAPPPAPATAERQAGGAVQGVIGILASDPSDALAMALAQLGRAVQGANPQ
jgi:AraC-like DNA-binding protein